MELKAEKRETFGKAVVTLRAKGLIPAELYGRGVQNLHLALSAKDFKKTYKATGENTIVTVVVGNEKHPALIYEVVGDPISGEPQHVDLYQVRMDEKIQTKVPLVFVGESLGVKDKGGVLVKTLQELPIEAMPAHLPHTVTVDISKLTDIGVSIHVADLGISPEVKVLVDGKVVVATIKAKLTEEQEAAMQAAGSVETIKVETEEKKAEREAKAAAEAPAEGAAPAAEAGAKK
ncbi:MAG: 50S ribosomal protein L25 [Candidatus Harrisonbacteria bacterium]|nr:50S ribosomal protein L25 [Candidatus Harrisonbacteria bacterium]